MSDKQLDFFEKTKAFLDVSYQLATGPNKRTSQFGQILESVFRKGYFTLQTIYFLADHARNNDDMRGAFAGSILDLSRRVFEDMVYMEYIAVKDKDKYSKQFIQYSAVDFKEDMDFLLRSGSQIDEVRQQVINQNYGKVPSDLKTRRNWAGKSVEQVVDWFVENGKMTPAQKDMVLKIYIAGNRKNHTSPSDILNYETQELLSGSSINDMEMGLMVTHSCLIKIALRLIDEIEVSTVMRENIKKCWDEINQVEIH